MEKLNFLSIFSVESRSVSVSYHSRINPVSIPYRSRIDPVSFSYRPPIVLLSFSLPEAETIRKQYGNNTWGEGGGSEDDRRWKRGGYVEAREKRKSTSGPPRWETDWRIVEVEVLE